MILKRFTSLPFQTRTYCFYPKKIQITDDDGEIIEDELFFNPETEVAFRRAFDTRATPHTQYKELIIDNNQIIEIYSSKTNSLEQYDIY